MVTQDRVKTVLAYDPTTGKFAWLNRPELPKWINTRVVGTEAGHLSRLGYILIGIDGVSYAAHRLAWLYAYGEMPTLIDHIDRDRSNNTIGNLRVVSRTDNAVNRTVISASGLKGVTWHRCGKWQAQIQRDGKHHYLGLFDDRIEAAKAYRDAALTIHGEWVGEMPELAQLGGASS
nr:MAG TPA: endonuclease [Caudoviricetes sp.]